MDKISEFDKLINYH